jgi:hypothetical protein
MTMSFILGESRLYYLKYRGKSPYFWRSAPTCAPAISNFEIAEPLNLEGGGLDKSYVMSSKMFALF